MSRASPAPVPVPKKAARALATASVTLASIELPPEATMQPPRSTPRSATTVTPCPVLLQESEAAASRRMRLVVGMDAYHRLAAVREAREGLAGYFDDKLGPGAQLAPEDRFRELEGHPDELLGEPRCFSPQTGNVLLGGGCQPAQELVGVRLGGGAGRLVGGQVGGSLGLGLAGTVGVASQETPLVALVVTLLRRGQLGQDGVQRPGQRRGRPC